MKFSDSILVTRSSMPSLDEYVTEIRQMWDTRWLTNCGPEHNLLESRLARYCDVPYASLMINGHAALEAAIEALGLHGEVITTPFTFASTTHALVRRGITPVMCDIRPDDYTLDPERIESLITPRTTGIVPVHVYGHMCDVAAIRDIADRHGLKVLYDGAHAFGETLDGAGAMSFGDATICSFHATKVFNTIEGGAVFYRDSSLGPVLARIRNFGITGPETVESVGGNFKMNEFCAAMGLCNLRHLDEQISLRGQAEARYRERLTGIPGLVLSPIRTDVASNHAYMPLVVDETEFGADRDEVCHALARRNIYARKYFYPLVSDFACYRGRFDLEATPVARKVAARILCLPLYAGLSAEQVDGICDTILGCGTGV